MPGVPVTSPDISNLDILVLFDISGAAPLITITNNSTIIHPTNLTWWFVITSPSGVALHTGFFATPDKPASVGWLNGQTWTMPDPWLSPFIPPTIEFSCSVPYNVTVYVEDSVSNVFSELKAQVICKPNGNSVAGFNFGQANTQIEIQCGAQKVYGVDTTNYTYQGLLGTSLSNTWTMTYPADSFGTVPPNYVVTNAPYVFIPIGYTGSGYTLNFATFALYAFTNGCSIKIQYKSNKSFAVWCGIDLCKLVCEMKRFYEALNIRNGQLQDDAALMKMNQISYLMSMALAGIVQPACQVDIHWMIREIEKLMGDANCGCTESAIGINGSSIVGTACCDATVGTTLISGSCAAPAVTFTLPLVVPLPWGTTSITASFTVAVGSEYEVWILPHPSSTAALPFAGFVTTGGSYTFYGLAPTTTYDIYIKVNCSASSTSGWVLAGTITTL